MKLIKPSFEILEQKPRNIIIPADMEIGPKMVKQELTDTIYRQIEIAGRTCYKSFDKITEDSAKPFVDRMMSNHHLSVLEHGTVYLKLPFYNCKYEKNHYSVVRQVKEDKYCYITTNLRVLVENNWLNDLKYLCEPTEFHEKRVTVRIICSIGTSREFNRHRASSITEQSTRYCNFSKDKFGNEVSFIIPNWLDLSEGSYSWNISTDTYINDNGDIFGRNIEDIYLWLSSINNASQAYMTLLKLGWKPQQAREVLPLATATEVVYTAYIKDWIHFFKLRCNEAAHPSARELAIPLREEFIKRGYLK